ncbi:MAG: translation initiation factor 2 [Oscillospiraceae bacterium]|nr:translation initiation factor 2 [Oscillospiraceae bacterium]
MVKGISRQVVVVRALDTKLFEQAIFLIRDGALPRQGITEEDILREANAAADTCLSGQTEQSGSGRRFWRTAIAAVLGAAATGLVWLLTVLL